MCPETTSINVFLNQMHPNMWHYPQMWPMTANLIKCYLTWLVCLFTFTKKFWFPQNIIFLILLLNTLWSGHCWAGRAWWFRFMESACCKAGWTDRITWPDRCGVIPYQMHMQSSAPCLRPDHADISKWIHPIECFVPFLVQREDMWIEYGQNPVFFSESILNDSMWVTSV